MRAKFRMLLLPAALLLLATLAWADDAPTGSGWFTRWFAPTKAPAKKTPEPADDDENMNVNFDVKFVSKNGINDAKTSPVSSALKKSSGGAGRTASPRAQAEAAYHRRNAVCLKLREVANATNDEALRQKVEQLETRIWDLYCRRTASVKVALKEK